MKPATFPHPEALTPQELAKVQRAVAVASQPQIIDLTAHVHDQRVRDGMPWQVKWNRAGWPSHYFRTREAAEAAIVAQGLGGRA